MAPFQGVQIPNFHIELAVTFLFATVEISNFARILGTLTTLINQKEAIQYLFLMRLWRPKHGGRRGLTRFPTLEGHSLKPMALARKTSRYRL